MSIKVQDAAKAKGIRKPDSRTTKFHWKHLECKGLAAYDSIKALPGISSYNRKLSEHDNVLLELFNRHVHGISVNVKLSAEQEGGACKVIGIYR